MTTLIKPLTNLSKLPDGKHPVDGVKNLTLRVRGNSRIWTFRYTCPLTSKEAFLPLGPLSTVLGLKTATEARDKAAALVRDGRCPKLAQDEERAAAKLAQIRDSERLTYRQYVTGLKADMPTKPRSYAAAIRYGVTILGDVADLRPDQITHTHLVEKLTPIWTQRGVATESVKYISKFLRLAQEDGHIEEGTPNPASMKKLRRAIDAVMPDLKHRKAVAFDMIPDLLAKLRQGRNDCGDALTYLIVELIILTALRSNEVSRLHWNHIDRAQGLIRIPRAMMKGEMAGADKDLTHFEVPLTTAMIRVLDRAKFLANPKTDTCPIFPSKASKKDRYFDDGTILDVLETLGFRQADAAKGEKETIHGFRSCFTGWANRNQVRTTTGADGAKKVERRWTSGDVQMCLAHVEKDETTRAYARTMPVEPRIPIIQAWNDAVEPKVIELDAHRPAPAQARGARRAGGGVY